MSTVMKKCCGLCPYSRKATLFLHPERASDFAAMAQNPYTDFVCHKTGETHEDEEESVIVRGEKSLTCAGFHALQCESNGSKSEIKIDYEDHFSDYYEMTEHHEARREEKQPSK